MQRQHSAISPLRYGLLKNYTGAACRTFLIAIVSSSLIVSEFWAVTPLISANAAAYSAFLKWNSNSVSVHSPSFTVGAREYRTTAGQRSTSSTNPPASSRSNMNVKTMAPTAMKALITMAILRSVRSARAQSVQCGTCTTTGSRLRLNHPKSLFSTRDVKEIFLSGFWRRHRGHRLGNFIGPLGRETEYQPRIFWMFSAGLGTAKRASSSLSRVSRASAVIPEAELARPSSSSSVSARKLACSSACVTCTAPILSRRCLWCQTCADGKVCHL